MFRKSWETCRNAARTQYKEAVAGSITYTDQTTQNEIVLTNTYGIMFNRAIDGVKVQGFGRGGGARVRFGNNATVAEISICWRNLTPFQLKDCWSVQEIEEQILNGTIVLHPLGTTVTYPIKQLKKLTVMKATPRYEGKYLDEPMDFVRPYANFEGVADDGKTATDVWFECSTLCK